MRQNCIEDVLICGPRLVPTEVSGVQIQAFQLA